VFQVLHHQLAQQVQPDLSVSLQHLQILRRQTQLLVMLGLIVQLDRSTSIMTAIGLSLRRVTLVTLALLDQPAQVVDQLDQLVRRELQDLQVQQVLSPDQLVQQARKEFPVQLLLQEQRDQQAQLESLRHRLILLLHLQILVTRGLIARLDRSIFTMMAFG
jgi:hypothetical protein